MGDEGFAHRLSRAVESLTPGYFALVMASGIISVGMQLEGYALLSTVLLVVCGAPLAGLAVTVATAPRWLLWRYGSLLDGGVRSPAPSSATRDVPLDGDEHPSEEPCRRTPRTA